MKQTNNTPTGIGERLRTLRKQDGHTQRKIAEFLDISQSQYAKIETGERNLKLTKLEKLAHLYCCPIEHILYGEEYKRSIPGFKSNKHLNLKTIMKMNKIINNLHEMNKIYEENGRKQ